jgi:hypothetical protein
MKKTITELIDENGQHITDPSGYWNSENLPELYP